MEISAFNRSSFYNDYYGIDKKQDAEIIIEKGKQSGKNKKDEEKNNEEVQRQVQEMRMIEEKVKMHELAHMSAGGGFSGSPSFEYKKGPDGKEYIVGGEVPIMIKEGKTPEETIQNMEQVRAAALAPADPSSQDRAVAAKAAAIAMKASQEMAEKRKNGSSENTINIYA